MKRVTQTTLAAMLLAAAPLALAAEKDKPAAKTAAKPAAAAAAAPTGATVATVDGKPILMSDIEDLAGGKLTQLHTQEYQLRKQALDELIARRLVEKEAAARGISSDELMRTEIDAKVPAITEAEQKAFYEQNKSRIGNMAEAEAMKQIEAYLRQQKVRDRQSAFVNELKAKTPVRVMLEPPRMTVDASDDPATGPANAPVQIVEFSDFQCPFCGRVEPTVKQLHEKYGDKIRVVFRDLPLIQIHPQAAKAAEAGACAADQGKFWEMHAKMFADQTKLAVEDLKKSAAEIGLNATTFNECLDSGKKEAEWKKDSEDAAKYGLSGTPAFFINGRLLSGAQPLEAFTAIIDEELELKGVPVPKTTAANTPAK